MDEKEISTFEAAEQIQDRLLRQGIITNLEELETVVYATLEYLIENNHATITREG